MPKSTLNFDEIETIRNTQLKYINSLPPINSSQYKDIDSILKGFFTLCDGQSYHFHLFSAEKVSSSIMIDKNELMFSCEKYLIMKSRSYPYIVNEVLSQYKKYFSYLERKANGRDIIFNICVPFVLDSDSIYLYGYYMFLDRNSYNVVYKPGLDLDGWL